MGHRMKGFSPLLIFLASVSILMPVYSQTKKSILEYYNSIPLNWLNNHRYTFKNKNNKWIARSNAGYDFEVTVDIKNGYLNITDSGTGGSTRIHEAALYRTSTGDDIIGINLIEFDGIGSTCTFKFYKPNDKWKDVTEYLLPKIDLLLFMDGTYNINHQEKLHRFKEFTKGITLLYQLPRFGTTMTVKIDLDRFIMENKQDGYGNNLKSAAYEILKSIKYREIKLVWDKKNDKFNTGGTALFAQTSDLEKKYIHIPHKEDAYSGKQNDAERMPILDALRKRWPNSDVVFVVKYFKANNGWAWTHVSPQSRDGKSQFEDELWLFQKVNGQWKAVEARGSGIDCEENPDCSDDKRFYNILKSKYPSAPADIFPY